MIFLDVPNEYGYQLDLKDPLVQKLYWRYKDKHHIPHWCPLSDEERLDFEAQVSGGKGEAMDDLEAYRLENKYPVYGVQSREKGLKYFYDDERRGIVISGMRGKTGCSIRQAKAICRELPEILREMGVAL